MKTLKFLVFAVLAVSMGMACTDFVTPQEPDNSDEQLVLTGTKWKLAALVDAQTHESVEPTPKTCNQCYTLEFDSDTTATGKSVSNILHFIVTPSNIKVLEMTEIWDGENNNVDLFYDALLTIDTYAYSRDELKIYYDNKNKYLSYKTTVLYNSCEVENPLEDLPWLKEIIDGIEKDAEAGYKQHARIYQCTYIGGTGFLLELCVDCPDSGYWLRSCEGESLCIMYGYAGDPCKELNVDFENKTLILEMKNNGMNNSCEVENPLEELPCLKAIVDETVLAIQNGNPLSVSIYQCVYGDSETGFLVDKGNIKPFYNCSGEILCIMGGDAGETCSELNIVSKKLIWEMGKNVLPNSCKVENPLEELPWLKAEVDEIEKNAEAGYKHHVRIYQCTYIGGTGFLLDLCVGCPDSGYWLRSCEGESLCVMYGHAGDPCKELNVDFENKKLIWEINN